MQQRSGAEEEDCWAARGGSNPPNCQTSDSTPPLPGSVLVNYNEQEVVNFILPLVTNKKTKRKNTKRQKDKKTKKQKDNKDKNVTGNWNEHK